MEIANYAALLKPTGVGALLLMDNDGYKDIYVL
jgi:hypothetical protein